VRPPLSRLLQDSVPAALSTAVVLSLVFAPISAAGTLVTDPEEDAPVVEQGRTGVVVGEDLSFRVKTPFGWVLDTDGGRSEGFCAVVYPEGSTWKNSRVGMCVGTSACRGEDRKSFERSVSDEVARHEKETQPEVIKDGASLVTADGKMVVVKEFLKDKWGGFTAEGYIREIRTTVVFALRARNRDDYQHALPAFRHLVESYALVTNNAGVWRANGKKKS